MSATSRMTRAQLEMELRCARRSLNSYMFTTITLVAWIYLLSIQRVTGLAWLPILLPALICSVAVTATNRADRLRVASQ